jgi:hypothetical protein
MSDEYSKQGSKQASLESLDTSETNLESSDAGSMSQTSN